jgi:hypothetical protein
VDLTYIGNFGPPHSTENDILWTLTDMGHEVTTVQEGVNEQYDALLDQLRWRTSVPDAILWTRTSDLSHQNGAERQWQMLTMADRRKVPTVGIHLDRWWGLARQPAIHTQPFFRVKHLFTADGGHGAAFAAAYVNHKWMPPAIAKKNCGIGTRRPELASDIAFVGSWRPGYHPEWQHRAQLVDFLHNTYRDRVKFWPKPNQPAIRGDDLKDLYASATVVVGDSCLVPDGDGGPMTRYCSDRIPETLGRGGLLIHPSVRGIDQLFRYQLTWNLGDWDGLKAVIDDALDSSDMSRAYRAEQVDYITRNHTYHNRLERVLRRCR